MASWPGWLAWLARYTAKTERSQRVSETRQFAISKRQTATANENQKNAQQIAFSHCVCVRAQLCVCAQQNKNTHKMRNKTKSVKYRDCNKMKYNFKSNSKRCALTIYAIGIKKQVIERGERQVGCRERGGREVRGVQVSNKIVDNCRLITAAASNKAQRMPLPAAETKENCKNCAYAACATAAAVVVVTIRESLFLFLEMLHCVINLNFN